MLQNFSLTHGILLCPSLHCVSTDLIPGEQAVMPKLYLKEADNPSRTEVSVESVEDLAVKDFRETASEKLDIPLDELCECCLGVTGKCDLLHHVCVFGSTCRRANSVISHTPSPTC